MSLNNIKISQKLLLSFLIIMVVFVASSIYQIVNLNVLSDLQTIGATRAINAQNANEAAALGYQAYRIIADLEVSRDIAESRTKWQAFTEEATGDLADMAKVADTDDEKNWVNEAKARNAEIADHYNQVVALVQADTTIDDETQKQIKSVNNEVDALVKAFETPLKQIVASIDNENQLGDNTYDAKQTNVTKMTVILMILSIVLSIFLIVILTNAIVKGIKKGVTFAETIAKGNLTDEVESEYLNRKDEIGMLSKALEDMRVKLHEIIGNIISGADSIAGASVELSSTAQTMSQGTSEQASAAEEVSTSMEQMVANIQQNTDNSMQTDKIAREAAKGVAESNHSAEIAMNSMKNIAEKIKIINDIAFQTNI